ncbi:hypothetical protein AQ490_16170 [Wenjunlia vitaminophila]|uniref:Polyketide synthase n=1 Tax=Wenjunlia vitaminophila TaxID=76728 RepID=A0A0T6LWR9_WENVI|nr:hypothetical protein AQ490_16170 [Wenjunlia vitaminophila]
MAAEPVAIVGMGCRLPGGVSSPDGLWQLLAEGRDVVGEVPADRWDATGHMDDLDLEVRRRLHRGGYLEDVSGFDPEFFGISPKEAEAMDPQQRLLLEVAWETLEHAGVVPEHLAGTRTGVFVGAYYNEYLQRGLADRGTLDAYTLTGGLHSVLAGRLSYTLDLHGPCVAMDTACSSSLSAVHQACQSLRMRESDLALAGGVNVILDLGVSMSLEAYGLLAPSGRCRTFDQGADGIVRAEGCGLVLLKRLADALRDGDRVLAVVRGSAVNQDGRSNGLTAPSGTAQRELLRDAVARAGIDPAQVGLVETHGTGTALGDPIEVEALAEVYGAGGRGRCALGAAKTNLGHAEAVSGVVGLLKAALCLDRGTIPKNLHFTGLNPNITLDGTRFFVPTEHTDWPVEGPTRLAAVSAFGMGGTNAHVVLEQAPAPAGASSAPPDEGALLFPLSGATDAALRDNARRLGDWLAGPGADAALPDVGHTLALRRSHRASRLAVVARNRAELVDRLRRLSAGEVAAGTSTGSVARAAGRGVVWVFSGHGSQWTGMGRDLLDSEPAFTRVVDDLDPVYKEETGVSLRTALAEDLRTAPADQVQPLIYAVQVGLVAVWRHYGVRPAAVVGHSMGEIAAAVAAGALSPADGARLVCRRSHLLRAVAGAGAMASVELPADEVERLLGEHPGLSVAIRSAPRSTVVSGPPDAVEALVDRAATDGLPVRRVASDVAFHSAAMDPLCEPLRSAVRDLAPGRPDVPFYSGTRAARDAASARCEGVLDAEHWVANLRDPVGLDAAVARAADDGHRLFVEVAPHPVVRHALRQTLDDAGAGDAVVRGTLRRDEPERDVLLENLGALHCHGVRIDWSRVRPGGRLVDLPTTAFQRRRHWRAGVVVGAVGGVTRRDADADPVLGTRVELAGLEDAQVWQGSVDASSATDQGHCLAMAVAAARAAGFAAPGVTGLEVHQPPAGPTGAVRFQSTLRHGDTDRARWELHLSTGDGGWWRCAQAEVSADDGVPADWVYHTVWVPRALPAGTGGEAGRWLVVADASGVGEQVRAEVEARGGTVSLVTAGELADLPPGALARRLADVPELDHVLYCAALDTPAEEPESPRWARRLTVDPMRLARVLADRGPDRPRMRLVTRFAQSVGGEPRVAPAQAALWGLGRGLAVELTEVWGGLVDLDDTGPRDAARLLVDEVLGSDGEDQVAFRDGRRHVTRLVRGALGPTGGRLDPEGCHLVIGATGSIGPVLISRLVALGARHLVLLGRRGLTGPSAEVARRLRAEGTAVTEVRADVADEAAMTALFARFGADLPPLHGVYNASLAGGYTELADLTDADIDLMLRPKVDGSVLLHRLSAGHDVRQFVLFSSTAALLGARGLTHYAAANYFLDSLARHRRTLGLPALVIDWGIWGEAFDQVHYRDLMSDSGLRPMPDATAVRALDSLLFGDQTHCVVAAVDWPTLADAYRSRIALHLIDEVAPAGARGGGAAAGGQAQRVRAATGAARRRLLQALVRSTVATLMGFDSPQRLGVDQRFFQIGMDSVMASRTQAQLSRELDCDLPPAAVFNYPTVDALTEYLLGALDGGDDAPAASSGPPDAQPGTAPSTSAGTPAAGSTPTDAPSGGSASADDPSEDELLRRLTERLDSL